MPAYLSLALILMVALALLWVLAVVLYARLLLSPPRMTDGKATYRLGRLSPADLGWKYETETYTGTDALKLAGWWIPAEGSTRTVLLLHGYADAKVGALAWAPMFRTLGFHVLLLDLRAHGESEGRYTTAGVREADDVAAVLNQLRAAHPTATREVYLFGASLGAAAASLAATRVSDITGLVLDSPVASFDAGAMAHARLLALPEKVIVPAALKLAKRLTGVEFGDSAVVNTLAKANCPVLLVVPTEDAMVSPAERQNLLGAFARQNAQVPASRSWEPQCPHLLAMNVLPEEYGQRLREFVGG